MPLSISTLVKGELTVVELASVFQLMREARVEREGLAIRTSHIRDGDVDALAVRRRVALRTLEVLTTDAQTVLHFRVLKAIHRRQLIRIFLFVAVEELNVFVKLLLSILVSERDDLAGRIDECKRVVSSVGI